jgi:hypothetical protein
LVCDGGGLPLTAVVTAANVNDTTMFQAVVADIPASPDPGGAAAHSARRDPCGQGL